MVIRNYPRDLRLVEDCQVLRLLRLRNRRDGGRILGSDVAAPAVAVPVICAARAAFVRLRIDRGRTAKWLPPLLPRSRGHHVRELRVAQRRHREVALPRAFEDVPSRIEL